jgi:hypothetical protein
MHSLKLKDTVPLKIHVSEGTSDIEHITGTLLVIFTQKILQICNYQLMIAGRLCEKMEKQNDPFPDADF